MRFPHRLLLLSAAIAGVAAFAQTGVAQTKPAPTVASARAWIDRAQADILKLSTLAARAEWVDETYITDDSDILAATENARLIARTTELVDEAETFSKLDLPEDVRRKILLLKLSLVMPAPHDPKLREELTQTASSLNASYVNG
jgi:peptidyl-dipeptidase A